MKLSYVYFLNTSVSEFLQKNLAEIDRSGVLSISVLCNCIRRHVINYKDVMKLPDARQAGCLYGCLTLNSQIVHLVHLQFDLNMQPSGCQGIMTSIVSLCSRNGRVHVCHIESVDMNTSIVEHVF